MTPRAGLTRSVSSSTSQPTSSLFVAEGGILFSGYSYEALEIFYADFESFLFTNSDWVLFLLCGGETRAKLWLFFFVSKPARGTNNE